jgi:hypothetical protein
VAAVILTNMGGIGEAITGRKNKTAEFLNLIKFEKKWRGVCLD